MLTRRSFIAGAAGLTAFMPENSQILRAFPSATSDLGKVKITGVKTASVMIKYPAHLVKILEAIRARLGEHYPLGIELNDEVCRRHLAEGTSYFD